MSLLVVEELDAQQETIADMVQSLSPKDVRSATDGETAMELLSGAHVDVIITDIDTPAIDGLEFMRRLADGQNSSSVILASSIPPAMLAVTEEMTKSYGITLLGIMQKPVTRAALETMLVRHAPARGKTAAATSDLTIAGDAPGRLRFAVDEIMAGLKAQQFDPCFEPRVDIATRRVIGASAQARWAHPQHGVVLPSAFVEPLEHAGKIDELTWAVLDKCLAFCVALQNAGLSSSISLKLSPRSLENAELANRAEEMAREHKVEASRICFEITQTAAAVAETRAIENLTRLSSKGFLLSSDDLQSARASAKQREDLTFSEVRIDCAAVTSGADEAAGNTVKSDLESARARKIKTCADGVETQDDWDMLQVLGFDVAQGYFIAKPMTAGAYLQWMSDLSTDPTSMFIS